MKISVLSSQQGFYVFNYFHCQSTDNVLVCIVLFALLSCLKFVCSIWGFCFFFLIFVFSLLSAYNTRAINGPKKGKQLPETKNTILCLILYSTLVTLLATRKDENIFYLSSPKMPKIHFVCTKNYCIARRIIIQNGICLFILTPKCHSHCVNRWRQSTMVSKITKIILREKYSLAPLSGTRTHRDRYQKSFIIENGTNLFSYLVKLIWKCWWCSPERDNSSFTEWMENPLDFIVKLKNNNQLSICQSFTFHGIYAFCWSFYMFSDSYIYILCSSFSLAVCIVI